MKTKPRKTIWFDWPILVSQIGKPNTSMVFGLPIWLTKIVIIWYVKHQQKWRSFNLDMWQVAWYMYSIEWCYDFLSSATFEFKRKK